MIPLGLSRDVGTLSRFVYAYMNKQESPSLLLARILELERRSTEARVIAVAACFPFLCGLGTSVSTIIVQAKDRFCP
jgi:hypothetical protein